ncbi:MAG: hypothetical protein R3B54_00125 [Bdellovibrionota bacterium]
MRHWADRNSFVLIGDTKDHDAEVARALGIDALLLTGGHHPIARLEATGSPVLSWTLKTFLTNLTFARPFPILRAVKHLSGVGAGERGF